MSKVTSAEKTFSQEFLEMQQDKFAMAEKLLLDIVDGDRDADYSELAFFAGNCGWDSKQVKKQLARVRTAERLKAIVGSKSDREQLFVNLKSAKEALATEAPRIADEISRLQSELKSLENNVTLTERRQEEVSNALELLRKDLLPPDIVASWNESKRMIGAEFRRISELDSEIQFKRHLLAGPPEPRRESDFVDNVRRTCSDWANRDSRGRNELTPAFHEARKKFPAEIEAMQAEHDILVDAKAEAMQEVEFLRDYHLSEEGESNE